MHALLQIVASNSLVFAVLAVCVALLGRLWKNPVGLHLLCIAKNILFIAANMTIYSPESQFIKAGKR